MTERDVNLLPVKLAQQALHHKLVEWQATNNETALADDLKELVSGLKEPSNCNQMPLQREAYTNNPSTPVGVTFKTLSVNQLIIYSNVKVKNYGQQKIR